MGAFLLFCLVVWLLGSIGATGRALIALVSSLFVLVGLTAFVLWQLTKHRRQQDRLAQMRIVGLPQIDFMSGVQFEQRLAVAFQDLGYRVSTTPVTGDFGCDLIAERMAERAIVQCKRAASSVGVDAVQQAHSALSYYKGNRAIVITNHYFTAAALKMAQRIRVECWDRNKLATLLWEASKARNPKPIPSGGRW